MKDELGGKNMTKFVGIRAKTYIYLKDDGYSSNRKRSNGEEMTKNTYYIFTNYIFLIAQDLC